MVTLNSSCGGGAGCAAPRPAAGAAPPACWAYVQPMPSDKEMTAIAATPGVFRIISLLLSSRLPSICSCSRDGQANLAVMWSGEVLFRGLERPSEPQLYLSYKQLPDQTAFFYSPRELVIRRS